MGLRGLLGRLDRGHDPVLPQHGDRALHAGHRGECGDGLPAPVARVRAHFFTLRDTALDLARLGDRGRNHPGLGGRWQRHLVCDGRTRALRPGPLPRAGGVPDRGVDPDRAGGADLLALNRARVDGPATGGTDAARRRCAPHRLDE